MVLRLRTEVQGPEGPATLMTKNHLAYYLQLQGKNQEALDLVAPSVELSIKNLGYNHRHRHTCMSILIAFLNKMGRYHESEHLLRPAFANLLL